MGFAKKKQAEKEDQWKRLARRKGWRCNRCGDIPPFGERDVFFDSGKGLCGYCAHISKKENLDLGAVDSIYT